MAGVAARPADVMLPRFAGGRHMAVDITVVSSLQAQLVTREAEEPGSALQHRFSEKWRKYCEACQQGGDPAAASTYDCSGGYPPFGC